MKVMLSGPLPLCSTRISYHGETLQANIEYKLQFSHPSRGDSMPTPNRYCLRVVGKGINSQPATETAKWTPQARGNTWEKMQMVPVGTGKICCEVIRARGHGWAPAASARLNLRECKGRRHKPCLREA